MAVSLVGSVAVAAAPGVGMAGAGDATMAGTGGAASGVVASTNAGTATTALAAFVTGRILGPMVVGTNGPRPILTAAFVRYRCDRPKSPAPRARTSRDATATAGQVLCATGGTYVDRPVGGVGSRSPRPVPESWLVWLRQTVGTASLSLALPVVLASVSDARCARLDRSAWSGSLDTMASNDELSICATVPARRARSVPPIRSTHSPTFRGDETVMASSMAMAKSRAVWNRVLTFRSRAFITARSKAGDTMLLMKLGRAMGAFSTLATTRPGSSAWNRGFLVSASQRTMPAAKMSARRSTGPEPACSGAM